MKKLKQFQRKLSLEKLRISALNEDSKIKIIGGAGTKYDGTGTVISTISKATYDLCIDEYGGR